jgi:tRNA nucleotidyltransferase/poly(A) polymerase
MKTKLPSYIKSILLALTERGFEAYVVGGAVRDLLLGTEPGDFDVTTSAHPEQVLEICHAQNWRTVDNLGNNFGCVIALVENVPIEITTFRGEAYGADAHKPEQVWYCDSLREDLSRRDFTVNAMALDIDGNLYDYFGGQADLQNKVLRTVGKAKLRYEEDALRMFRACRFVAQLGFNYEQEDDQLPAFGMEGTPYKLERNLKFPLERVSGLSLERVRKELDKMLISKYAGKGLMLFLATGLASTTCRVKENGEFTQLPILPELEHLAGLKQNPRFHCYDTWEHTLAAIDNSPQDLEIRWALLLHDIGKGLPDVRKLNKEGQPSDHGHEAKSAELAREILARLRYPEKFSKLLVWLVAEHMRFAPMLLTGEKTLLRWVRSEATSGNFRNQKEMAFAYEKLVEIFLADMGATHAAKNSKLMADGRALGEQVIEIAATKMPVATSDLKISGKDLLTLIPQTEIKNALPYLLERVQSGNLPNEKEALLAAIQKYSLKHNIERN